VPTPDSAARATPADHRAAGQQPGRFTAADRHLVAEDRLQLTSVGIDIGSATSHLLFSRLELERQDGRYVLVRRTVLHDSAICFTPYVDDTTIDGAALGRFIHDQYAAAGLRRAEVDTGALILTGVALRRQNARAIAELFADEAGRFVAVSAGDQLEATLAAHGAGAVARSVACAGPLLHVDIGGGTAKLAVCRAGQVSAVAALDLGARLLVVDAADRIVRLEPAARRIGAALGLALAPGGHAPLAVRQRLAAWMADALLAALAPDAGPVPAWLWRTPPLVEGGPWAELSFSGGVAEFLYGRQAAGFGDLGDLLAAALGERLAARALPVREPAVGIRATVLGASQYAVQVSGSTIYVAPPPVLPLRNVPVVAPRLPLGPEIDAAAVRAAIAAALARLDLAGGERPVALALRWEGSASYRRLCAFAAGVLEGLAPVLARGHPLVLVCDGDLGGLLGLHFREEQRVANAVVSIDGIELREFDYLDIGALLPGSGAVPVVIKSLVFPPGA
jgi:ethanolamine utilization protein EutA